MNITTAQVKDIRTAFAKLKPVKVTLDGNRSLTIKEAVFALAQTLERMKKRGFDVQEIAERLREKGIDVKSPTLAKYLNEFRRGQKRKTDSSAMKKPQKEYPADTEKPLEAKIETVSQPERTPGSFTVRQDTPLDEL